MKNEFTSYRLYNNYFLKTGISFLSVSMKKVKTHWGRFRKSDKKPPLFAEAVSDGIAEFFEEMGYVKR